MFTVDQYRAKAAEYRELLSVANVTKEVREFQKLERSFTKLADNAQWMIDNRDKLLRSAELATVSLTPESPAQSISQE
jgi:hypothetical protein